MLERCKRIYSFLVISIKAWDKLSEGEVSAKSVPSYKEKLDKYGYRDEVDNEVNIGNSRQV